MTDADPMLAWLRGALTTAQSEAEAAAEATGSANWQYEPSGYLDATSPAGGMVAVGAHDFLEPDRGRFVAAHDPAAVLRRIAADRKILELHTDDGCHDCMICAKESEERNERGYAFHEPLPYPCATVRLLAEAWGWTEDIHEAETRSYTEVAEALKGSLRRIVDTMPTGHPVANFLEASADWIGRRPLYYHGRADRPAVSEGCYEASWGWVHVKPGCHCPR